MPDNGAADRVLGSAFGGRGRFEQLAQRDPCGGIDRPYAHVAKLSNVPPAFVVTQRINLGLHALLGRLRAHGNWRRIAFELWPFVEGDPSTPMGEAEALWLESHAR